MVVYLNQEPGDKDSHVGVAGPGGDGGWLQDDPWPTQTHLTDMDNKVLHTALLNPS